MNTLGRILSLWLALAFLAPGTYAQGLSEAIQLPEGIETTGDTTEVRALTAWALEHRDRYPQDAEQIAQRALTLARELGDQRGIGECLMILGNLASASLYEAEVYYTEAREAFARLGDERALARSSINLGRVYSDRGDFRAALTHYFGALNSLQHLGDTLAETVVLLNIGTIHIREGNQNEALSYFERAATLVESLDEPEVAISTYNNLGNVLSETGMYERAETILRRAVTISEEHGDRYFIVMSSNNLGALLNKRGFHQSALPFLLTAGRLGNELGDQQLLVAVWNKLGESYMGLGEYDRALSYVHQSLTLAREMASVVRQMEAHETLSRIYEAVGNHEQALIHHRHYAAAKDSVFIDERAEVIAEMQTRYETEEARRTNERLEQEIRIQTLQMSHWRIGMFAGAGGLLLILGVLYYRYRLKQRANRMLEELDAAKSRFFANISHEFRTPLTVILGGLQDAIAGRFNRAPNTLLEQHHVMLRNARQLQSLIDEVLALNRLEAGRLELRPLPGDLVRFLQRIVETHAPLAERKRVRLTFESSVESCARLFDAEKIEKIVGNLLSNALKFTPKDGSVHVRLHCGEITEIVVTDSGSGIPSEGQSIVFERFTQLDEGSLQGGTGIGLALAKELAELHGGTIDLESVPNQGSTFTVRLPLDEVDVSEIASAWIPLPDLTIGGDGYGVPDIVLPENESESEDDRTTVLLIEDNADVRAYVRRSLEESYRILEATDGEDGLRQARAELPDLIVSDVMLPGITGYDVVRRLKAEAATECIPIVMLTARAADADQAEGYGSGAEVYLTKPFSPESLQAAVARLLEERRRLRRRLQNEVMQDEGVSGNGTPTLSDRARAIVLEHLYDENFDVERLASCLSMSRRTLHRHIKQEMGLSPSNFIRVLRLEHARKLLSDGVGSVSEVAYAVGFNSLSVFSRAYRTHYGTSPSSHSGRSTEVSE